MKEIQVLIEIQIVRALNHIEKALSY